MLPEVMIPERSGPHLDEEKISTSRKSAQCSPVAITFTSFSTKIRVPNLSDRRAAATG